MGQARCSSAGSVPFYPAALCHKVDDPAARQIIGSGRRAGNKVVKFVPGGKYMYSVNLLVLGIPHNTAVNAKLRRPLSFSGCMDRSDCTRALSETESHGRTSLTSLLTRTQRADPVSHASGEHQKA